MDGGLCVVDIETYSFLRERRENVPFGPLKIGRGVLYRGFENGIVIY